MSRVLGLYSGRVVAPRSRAKATSVGGRIAMLRRAAAALSQPSRCPAGVSAARNLSDACFWARRNHGSTLIEGNSSAVNSARPSGSGVVRTSRAAVNPRGPPCVNTSVSFSRISPSPSAGPVRGHDVHSGVSIQTSPVGSAPPAVATACMSSWCTAVSALSSRPAPDAGSNHIDCVESPSPQRSGLRLIMLPDPSMPLPKEVAVVPPTLPDARSAKTICTSDVTAADPSGPATLQTTVASGPTRCGIALSSVSPVGVARIRSTTPETRSTSVWNRSSDRTVPSGSSPFFRDDGTTFVTPMPGAMRTTR